MLEIQAMLKDYDKSLFQFLGLMNHFRVLACSWVVMHPYMGDALLGMCLLVMYGFLSHLGLKKTHNILTIFGLIYGMFLLWLSSGLFCLQGIFLCA